MLWFNSNLNQLKRLISCFNLNLFQFFSGSVPVLFQFRPGSASGHQLLDPVKEVGDSGVDAVLVLVGAALPPAHHARQEPGLLVARHQGAATVALAGVLPSGPVPGADHVLGDVEPGVEATLLQRNPRQHQPLEEPGGGAELRQAAPTRHGGVADGCQCPDDGAVPGGKANGHHVETQLHRAVQLQQGQVAVGAGLVVTSVDQNFDNTPPLLGLLLLHPVMFTFTEESDSSGVV